MCLLQVPHLLIDQCNHLFDLIVEDTLQRLAIDIESTPKLCFSEAYRVIPICELTMPMPG
jgi:hypothetical protein